MATDTDVTATRLRLELHVARHAMERAYAAYDQAPTTPYLELTKLSDAMDAADKAFDAALDTLIQYHRSAGAVEALEDQPCKYRDGRRHQSMCDSSTRPYPCYRCKALAAAQARLAAYEEER